MHNNLFTIRILNDIIKGLNILSFLIQRNRYVYFYKYDVHPFLPTRNKVWVFTMHKYVCMNGVQINDIHWNTPRFSTGKVGLTVSYDTNIFYICILLGINSTPIEYKLCTPFFRLGDGRIINGYSIQLYRKGMTTNGDYDK